MDVYGWITFGKTDAFIEKEISLTDTDSVKLFYQKRPQKFRFEHGT